jgi:hypothetical protein
MFAIQEPFVSTELDYRRERILRSTRGSRVTPPSHHVGLREWLRRRQVSSRTHPTQPGVVPSH